jgi:hypothetical protein
VNILKLAVLFIFCVMLPAGVLADTKPTKTPAAKPIAMVKAEISKESVVKPEVPAEKNAKKAPVKAVKQKPEGLVIGKNLKIGMSLEEAIQLLGTPLSIKVKRGTESTLDSISIEYASHGIVIHFLNGKSKIEALEVRPQFVGRFAEGVKMGTKVAAMIDKYGVPQSMNESMARYPEKGLYFSLKENVLIAAHVFAKNSKLLSHQLYKNKR